MKQASANPGTLWQDMASSFPQSMIGNPLGQGFAETWMKAFQQFQNGACRLVEGASRPPGRVAARAQLPCGRRRLACGHSLFSFCWFSSSSQSPGS